MMFDYIINRRLYGYLGPEGQMTSNVLKTKIKLTLKCYLLRIQQNKNKLSLLALLNEEC